MTTQGILFQQTSAGVRPNPILVPQAASAHRSPTSAAAAKVIAPRVNQKRELVFEIISASGTYGATRCEIAKSLSTPEKPFKECSVCSLVRYGDESLLSSGRVEEVGTRMGDSKVFVAVLVASKFVAAAKEQLARKESGK